MSIGTDVGGPTRAPDVSITSPIYVGVVSSLAT
jgi:hypothetical protein